MAYFLPGFAGIPPIDRDEPRFAQATKQMIETGNYSDIRFQKETRYKKPVGIYWLQAASVKLLNPERLNEIWAYRVPSLIGATGSVLMTAALGSLLFGPAAGFLASVLLAASLLLNVEARLAKTDAFMLLCVLVAQYVMAKAYLARHAAQKTGKLAFLLFWTAQGVGFLVKGPILLLITLGTLIGLRIVDKDIVWFRALRPRWGIPLALLIAAPWFVIIMLSSHGEFAVQSAGNDMLAKIWQGQNRGMIPPGLHLLAFPVVFFPGSLLAMLAIPYVWNNRSDPPIRFCLSWIVPMWLVFELSMTKLPHYVMPAYPAIAMLAAYAAGKIFQEPSGTRWNGLPRAAMIVWVLAGLLLLLTLAAPFLITGQPVMISALIAGITLVFMQAASIKLYATRSANLPAALAMGSLLFTLLVFGTTFPALSRLWMTPQVVQVAEKVKPCSELKIASAAYNEPSLIFLAGTNTSVINDGAAVAELMKRDACHLGLVEKKHEEAFSAAFKKSAMRPEALAHFDGPNIGSGKRVKLTLYRMPQEGAKE